MQLDLLQEELVPDEQGKVYIPLKKAKLQRPPALEPQSKDIDATALPPLPDSLLPKFASNVEADSKHLEKNPDAFKTISEAAKVLSVPQHVLRFWESRFAQIKPLKMRGGRRYYRPEDMEILSTIKHLLYKQGYTIKGAKKAFSSGGHQLTNGARSESKQPERQEAAVKELKLLTDKQQSQLAVIRQELLGLRDTLKSYL